MTQPTPSLQQQPGTWDAVAPTYALDAGKWLDWSREAIYALGFFGFWGLGIASSTLALYLARGANGWQSASNGNDSGPGLR